MSAIGKLQTGKCIFDSKDGWKIFYESKPEDFEYSLFKDEYLFCISPTEENCHSIISSIRFSVNMRNAEKHDARVRKEEREAMLKLLKPALLSFCPHNYGHTGYCKNKTHHCGECIAQWVEESLRRGEHQ